MDAVEDPQEEKLLPEPDEAPEDVESAGTGALETEVTGETVNITQGSAQTVKADKVHVEQGGIARVEARFVDVKDGGVGIVQGENVTITDGGAGIVAADHVKMQDSMAMFVAANQIEGEDVTVLFDVRAAVVFALVLGVISSVLKMITRRRS